jgi:hypothetical protein
MSARLAPQRSRGLRLGPLSAGARPARLLLLLLPLRRRLQ